MRMGVHTQHTRVRRSGFGWLIGQNNAVRGQSHFALTSLAEKCPFLTLKKLFSACVSERRLSPSPVFLRVFDNFFPNF